MNLIITKDFSLKHTIDSGQFFCFEVIDDFYYVYLEDIVFKVKQEENTLYYFGIEKERLIKLFSLNLDLIEITKDFIEDEYLLKALEKYWGLRLMKQDLWQTIIGFVCSSASNIPKIKNNLKLISKYFGEKVLIDGYEFYTFPKPGKINDLDILILSKTGYRAKYIFNINIIIKNNPNLLKEIENMNYLDSKTELMKLPGIGSKVADCICLFALGHNKAFPIDTWVKQIFEDLYLKKENASIKEIEFAIKKYFSTGEIGLKQQYLFHYYRNKKSKILKN